MPRISCNEKQLLGDFKKCAKLTGGFKRIPPGLIARKPQHMRLLRMVLGLGLEEMAELVGKKFATVSQYERGRIRSIPLAEAVRMAELIASRLPKEVTPELVLENFAALREKSHGGLAKGLQRAEGAALTAQETRIRELLTELDVPFECHKTLSSPIGPLNFDFVINGKAIIECTESANKTKAESLAFRILKAKANNPYLTAIAVIPDHVTEGYLRRLSDFDLVVRGFNVARLRCQLKKLLSAP